MPRALMLSLMSAEEMGHWRAFFRLEADGDFQRGIEARVEQRIKDRLRDRARK